MSANDVIKNSVFDILKNGMGFSFVTACIILVVACLIGAYLFILCKSMSKSAFYSKDLNITEIIYELRTNKRPLLISALSREKGGLAVNWLEHHGEMRV